ncbi:ATP-binding protein [Kineococcus sp. NUM-3379]
MCDSTPAAQVVLPMDLQAARQARSFLDRVWCGDHHSTLQDEAMLLVSELVTNAVVHGAPPVALRVECDGGAELVVAVSDGSPQPPLRRESGRDAVSGRGIALVDLLSDRWGVDVTGGGKTTWFRLRA